MKMNPVVPMKMATSLVLSILLFALPGLGADPQKAEVSIDLKGARHAIDRRIFGQFIEHFGRIIQGGLSAELLQNRKFYPIDPDRTQVAQPWKPESDRSNVSYVIDRFESLDGISSQRISVFGDSHEWRGIKQSGFNVVGGKPYTAYAWIKTAAPGGRIAFRLESLNGMDQVQAEVVTKGEGWQKYEVQLTPSQELSPAVFRVLFNSSGSNWIGAVSLMPSDNVDGMRRDVLELVKAMSPPIIRWPGGGYPDGYNWQAAIGPRDRRPPQPILPFGQPYGYDNGIDPNDFGTDEFLRFCEIIGADPYITANFGSGTPEMAGSWVEYTNGPPTSTWGARRAANGHPQPYQVRNWSVGNEVWGDPFESGHSTATGYAYFLLPMVKAMRAADPQIQVTAVGGLGDMTGADASWNETVIGRTWKDVDLLAIHHYYPGGFRPLLFQGHPLDFYYAVAADPWIFEAKLRSELNKIDQITTPPGKIKVALDEWSEWDWDFAPPADTPERSSVNQFIDLINKTGLEFNQTERDGLFNARMLHMLMRLSERVPIGARTHMINSLGAIRTDSTRSFLTAPGVVMQLYRNHSGDSFVPLNEASATFDVPENGWSGVPYLDAVATAQGDKLFIHLVNFHASKEMDVHIRIASGKLKTKGTIWRIAPPDFMSRNDFDLANVVLTHQEMDSLSSDMVQHLPPHSMTTIEADLR
jgi:alpha-N-arabinofuranosidase